MWRVVVEEFSLSMKLARQNQKLSRRKVAEMVGVSEASIRSYETGLRTPSYKTHQKITDVLGLTDNGKPNIKEPNKMDSRIIDNQQLVIDYQKEEIANLKALVQSQPIQSLGFDSLEYDFKTEVEIDFNIKGVRRRMSNHDSGYKKLAKELKIPYDELLALLSPNEWYPMNQHPINAIIDKSCIRDLEERTRFLPRLLDTLKLITGDHHMSMPIVYRHNGTTVATMCYILIHWLDKPIKVISKNKLLV